MMYFEAYFTIISAYLCKYITPVTTYNLIFNIYVATKPLIVKSVCCFVFQYVLFEK